MNNITKKFLLILEQDGKFAMKFIINVAKSAITSSIYKVRDSVNETLNETIFRTNDTFRNIRESSNEIKQILLDIKPIFKEKINPLILNLKILTFLMIYYYIKLLFPTDYRGEIIVIILSIYLYY